MANNQIALLAQTPVFDTPFESQGKALQIRNLMNQGEVQNMDMQQRRQAIADDGAARDVYRNVEDPADQIKALYKVNPKAAQSAEKSQLDARKTRADIGKTEADTKKTMQEAIGHQFEIAGQLAGAWASDPGITKQKIQSGLAAALHSGVISPEIAQAKMSELQGVGEDSRSLNAWSTTVLQQVMKAKDQIALSTPDANAKLVAQTAVRGQDTTANTAMRGQDIGASTAAAGQSITATGQALTDARGRDANALAAERLAFDKSPQKLANKPMSATMQKELFEADDTVQASKNVIATLTAAKELNQKAYSGYGAKTRAMIRSNLPGQSESADATVNLDNMMTSQALDSLKAVFGGMPTEGERKILLEIQASADKTPKQREEIMDRAIAAAGTRQRFNESKALSLRDGSYNKTGPEVANAAPQQKAPTASGGQKDGATGVSKSGKPIVLRNGQWEYQ